MSGEEGGCPDCAVLRAELDAYRAYRTLGGPPRPPDREWRNQNIGSPQPGVTDDDIVRDLIGRGDL